MFLLYTVVAIIFFNNHALHVGLINYYLFTCTFLDHSHKYTMQIDIIHLTDNCHMENRMSRTG